MDALTVTKLAYQGQLNEDTSILERLKDFSYKFTFGRSFLLAADVGHGAWALSWIIAGLLKPETGVILRNSIPYDMKTRRKNAWCVRRDEIKRLGLFGNQTLKWQIQHGLQTVENQYFCTEAEYIEQFSLTPERYNRPFRYLSNEAWRASCAIGLAHGKSLFCFPHMQYMRPDFDEEGYQAFFKGIVEVLKKAGALVLIPAKVTVTTRSLCDEIIPFE